MVAVSESVVVRSWHSMRLWLFGVGSQRVCGSVSEYVVVWRCNSKHAALGTLGYRFVRQHATVDSSNKTTLLTVTSTMALVHTAVVALELQL